VLRGATDGKGFAPFVVGHDLGGEDLVPASTLSVGVFGAVFHCYLGPYHGSFALRFSVSEVAFVHLAATGPVLHSLAGFDALSVVVACVEGAVIFYCLFISILVFLVVLVVLASGAARLPGAAGDR